jgi:hypothetical protein
MRQRTVVDASPETAVVRGNYTTARQCLLCPAGFHGGISRKFEMLRLTKDFTFQRDDMILNDKSLLGPNWT